VVFQGVGFNGASVEREILLKKKDFANKKNNKIFPRKIVFFINKTVLEILK
jgi:hypothetical protein